MELRTYRCPECSHTGTFDDFDAGVGVQGGRGFWVTCVECEAESNVLDLEHVGWDDDGDDDGSGDETDVDETEAGLADRLTE